MYKEFFEMFDIPPMTKKGDKYFTSIGRFAEMVAEEDMYPALNNDFIVEMENELLTYKPEPEISITCSHGDFECYFQVTDPSDSDNWYKDYMGEGKTRLESLLNMLMENPELFKKSVRKVISKITNWDLKPFNRIESIPVTFTVESTSPCGSLAYKHLEE